MEPSSVSGSPGSLGTEWGGGSQDGVELGTMGGSKGNIVANASRWAPPQGGGWGHGEERPTATCIVKREKDGDQSQ